MDINHRDIRPSPATYSPFNIPLLQTHRSPHEIRVTSTTPIYIPARSITQVPAFARELAETFIVQTLVKHVLMIFGVWQNVCAFGIFDNLWETLDTLWELLTSIAIGSGSQLPQPSTEEHPSSTSMICNRNLPCAPCFFASLFHHLINRHARISFKTRKWRLCPPWHTPLCSGYYSSRSSKYRKS